MGTTFEPLRQSIRSGDLIRKGQGVEIAPGAVSSAIGIVVLRKLISRLAGEAFEEGFLAPKEAARLRHSPQFRHSPQMRHNARIRPISNTQNPTPPPATGTGFGKGNLLMAGMALAPLAMGLLGGSSPMPQGPMPMPPQAPPPRPAPMPMPMPSPQAISLPSVGSIRTASASLAKLLKRYLVK